MKASFIINLSENNTSVNRSCTLDIPLPSEVFIKLFATTVNESFDGLLNEAVTALQTELLKASKPKEAANGKKGETV